MRTLLVLLLTAAAAAAQPKSKVKALCAVSCADVCSSLAKAIQDDPRSLTTRLEDALVISESCTAEIVATAIATVNGDPLLTRKIIETAQGVLPWRRREIEQAASLVSVPAAVAVVEPQFEVRRALVAQTKVETPLEEVRRAEVPEVEIRRAVVSVVKTSKKSRRR
jgi:hypothetical protein